MKSPFFKLQQPSFGTTRALEGRRKANGPDLPPVGTPRKSRQTAPAAITGPSDPDVMLLDEDTFRDLEIFTPERDGESLFDLCNLTRTRGGAKALRRRMQRPWSSAGRIRAVQDSLEFIRVHRSAFGSWPTFATTDLVDDYLCGILPLITTSNILEFSVTMLELRLGDIRSYGRIEHGVKGTARLLATLCRIVAKPELRAPSGELAELLHEMRALLERGRFASIPELESREPFPWTMLRVDQVFRMHEKQAVDRLLQLTYEVDALIAMADATRRYGFVMPRIEEGPLAVRAEGVIHPFLTDPVANSFALDQDCRMLFLTGPNMAGKTTYLRACALALYLAHLGMGVPARAFSFTPAERLFSSISLSDDLRGGISFFRAEALRVKTIAQAVAEGHRVLALMDEPFKGTNVKDAIDASRTILERFAGKRDNLFMFSSHLIELSDRMGAHTQIDCRHFEAREDTGKLHFDYVLRDGVSSQRLGMRVLRDEGIFELLDREARRHE